MNKESFIPAVVSLIVLSVILIVLVAYSVEHTRILGPLIAFFGLFPLTIIKFSGRSVRSNGADVIFGAIDTGVLMIAALIGASLAGILGAIIGSAIGDSITDGLAGLFEGSVAERLREYGIQEARTSLSSSMGKMSGCLIGAGSVLTVAWTFLGLAI
ncbi:hypothetical protein Mzhil_0876 [Methanosalsum zhilinae DSM 4017]|uniref:Uncharacterized protein n=1 Tax=Methanosalsum zhilinae (strain DSM 4017 / NBRC 107636 / OCM 62 / WeN5) TaxID=679901 RepID=F7XL81_METZD|nr:hypothetical protein [Methanosalsum zhilinae]AEH60738.1 hypothetical protein Mzhil_0876 [Methanosalsum zhilinae DSM 4017]